MERHVRGWLGMVMAAAVLFVAATPTRAAELLANPGFESWTGSAPTGWLVIGATANEAPGAAGSAARIEATGPARVVQSVPVTAGATYAAAILVQADQPGVIVSLEFMSPSGGAGATLHSVPASSAFQSVSFSAVAPLQATSVRFTVDMTPPGGSLVVVLDSASLTESAPPPPTATPTDPPTPTPGTPASTPTPGTTVPTPAATSTVTATTSPPKTATSTKTPTATAGTATPTPTRPPGTATPAAVSTPKPPKDLPPGIPSGFGGLVLNGDFELLDDEVPAYWSKVGGELALEPGAFRGNAAGAIDSSTTSTKWLYQVIPVSGGTWYAASGQARIRWGNGEAWLRVSWYASGDGSGREMDQADSPSTTATGWQPLATGAILAPGGANSARVRLMLRPEPGFASAAFDDVVFATTDAPTPTATASPGSTSTPTPATASPAPATPPPVARPPGNAATSTSTVAGVVVPGPAASPAPAFVVQPVAGPLSLRISEVLADPAESGRDAPFEWVELVNVGAEPVDLAGWTIADGAGSDDLPAAVVPPGGFVVIAGRNAQLPGTTVVRVPDGEIGGGLNNGGDTVRLLAPDGAEVDIISFGDDRSIFDPAPPAPTAGSTLGVIAAGADPAPENWAITSAPTPGAPNTFPPPARDTAQATATSAPQGIVSAPGAATQPAGAPDATFEDGTKDGSAIPWILLGGSIGGSAAAVAIAGWQRLQRRKGGPRGGD